MNNIDMMFDELKSTIVEEVESAQKKTIEKLSEENKELKSVNSRLVEKLKQSEKLEDNFELMTTLVQTFKNNLNQLDIEQRNKRVYAFLDMFFKRDFFENTYDCPLWLGCVTQYYSHRKEVINVLKQICDTYIPEDIDSFCLPQDWTTEELDIVFDTMGNHIVCNNELFENNLRFWKSHALYPVWNVCHNVNYSEIPWQFLLRNPNLLKDKYLVKMGKMAFDKSYIQGWRTLFKIDQYQTLTEEQLKTIIDNINPHHLIGSEKRFENVYRFLLNHLEYVTKKPLLVSIYTAYSDSYDFRYKNCLLKMPYEYSLQWMKEHKNLEWLKMHRENFTKEQITELTLAAMED